MRVGIILPNWIGDVVMATPTLRALRKHVPAGSRIVGIMRPYVAQVLAGNPWFDDTICYSKKRSATALSGGALRRRLRDADLDTVVLLTNSLRTAWMAWRSGARERIGYSRDGRGWLLTTKLYEPRQGLRLSPLPQIDSYLNIAYAMGCPQESAQLELSTSAEDEKLADRVWQQLGLPEGKGVVVVNSGGAFGAAKDWPSEYFAELAQRIVRRNGMYVLINCGPNERENARSIVERAGDSRVVSLADQEELPIGLTKACIRRSRLLVTTDSGPRFFGVAFQRPVVTLFGPTSTRWTRTHSELEVSLSLQLDCQPCMRPTCPLHHHRCMRELTVDMVYAHVDQQLNRFATLEEAA
ncbi:MAG: lipopolysaccharide heptosyltransferase II [Planctomycetales bacterium]|nr:lipopolysaccharide heptosyltransferase II [Planctomycetales bacterium]